MPSLRGILDYIIYLNFVIATSAFALAAGTASIFNIENYLEYGLFGFFATLFVYNSQRLLKAVNGSGNPWLAWVYQRRKLVRILSIGAGILAMFFFIKVLNEVTIATVAFMSIAVLISIFYVVRIGKKNIREISYLKTHAIALTWTLVVAVFPVVNESVYHSGIFIYVFAALYLYFLAIAIPFDIRDLKYDLPTQRTIPQIVGARHAKKVAICLLSVAALGITYGLSQPLIALAILVQIVLVALTTEKRKDIYFNLLIDGSISLLGLSYLTV